MPAPLSVTRDHLVHSILGVVGFAFALAMEFTEHRLVAILAGAAALLVFGSRIVFRVEPRRGEARVVWCFAGIALASRARLALGRARRVSVEDGLVSIEAGNPSQRLTLWPVGGAVAARRLGERIACALGVPLRDTSDGHVPERVNPSARTGLLERTWLPGGLALAVAAAQLSVAGCLAWRTHSFLARAESTLGTVVEVRVERFRKSTVYSPVVRFRTAAGQETTFVPAKFSSGRGRRDARTGRPVSGSASPLTVGDVIEVLYDPLDPAEARVTGLSWLGPAAVAGFGLLSLGAGALLLRTRRRLRSSSA